MPLFPVVLIAAVLAGGQPPGPPPAAPPCGACLAIAITPEQADLLPPDLAGLELLLNPERASAPAAIRILEQISRRNGRPGLIVPLDADSLDSPAGAATIVVIDAVETALAGDQLSFAARTRATQVRAAGAPAIRIGVRATAEQVSVLASALGVYWDFFVIDAERPSSQGAWRDVGALDSVAAALRFTRAAAGETHWLWRLPVEAIRARRALDDAASAVRAFPAGLVPVDDVRVACEGRVTDAFMNPASLSIVALADGCGPDGRVTVRPDGPYERAALSGDAAIITVAAPTAGRVAESTEVAASRRLTVEEVVARHQAAAARQKARLETLISSGTLTLTFEALGFPAPITVTSRTTIYREGARIDLAQRDVRINGMSFGERGVPRVPLLEPERVATPPLEIALTDRYRYRLAGEEDAGGQPCYVVAFDPIGNGPSFRGRAWISRTDLGLVRISAVQTGLRGPIVSSEQLDDFDVVDGVRVLARSETRQVYQGAAYRTPLVRVLALEAHEVNPASFAARRAETYASNDVIVRDTPSGFRYLDRKTRVSRSDVPAGTPLPEGQRLTRVRTLAFGAIVDPNISNPLPFAGLSYLDFDLFGTGAQLNGFFGGTYGQLAFSVPSVAGSRWQVAGRAFAIVSTYNDRAFDVGREQYDRNIRQRPAHASIWTLRPLGRNVLLRAGYELDYTHLESSDLTGASFVVPADQVSHGLRLALEAQRSGWDLSAWWNPARRSGWRAWGLPGEYDSDTRDFQRYGLSAARSFVLSPALVARADLSLVGGNDLDRFSRFTFGTFDNRLHGYPSALIRYNRGGVARGSLAWAAAPRVRLDGFVDGAVVRDPGFARGLTSLAGFGAAVETPAPLGTLVAVEWGYAPQGVNADGRRGTHVVRITGYKVF